MRQFLAWLLAEDMRAGGIGEAHRGGSVETAAPGPGRTHPGRGHLAVRQSEAPECGTRQRDVHEAPA
jgi:hypothetical protein